MDSIINGYEKLANIKNVHKHLSLENILIVDKKRP